MASRDASEQVRGASSPRTEPSGGAFALSVVTGGFGVAAVACAVHIAKCPAWTLSAVDGLFWGAVVAVAAVHYLELRRSGGLAGRVIDGESSWSWRTFALVLGAVAAAVWVAAQVVQVGRS
jgi:hypothetical protein